MKYQIKIKQAKKTSKGGPFYRQTKKVKLVR